MCFEIGAIFHSPVQWVKKRASFKTNKFLQAIQSFSYCLYSRLFCGCTGCSMKYTGPEVSIKKASLQFDFFLLWWIIWHKKYAMQNFSRLGSYNFLLWPFKVGFTDFFHFFPISSPKRFEQDMNHLHPLIWIFNRFGCPNWFWQKFCQKKCGQVEPFLS